MHELLSVASMAGIAALLIGSIGIWTWWRKARNRRLEVSGAHRGAAMIRGADSSRTAAAGTGFSETEDSVGYGEAKNSGDLKGASPEVGGTTGTLLDEKNSLAEQIAPPAPVREQPPAEKSPSWKHSIENLVNDSAEVPPVETDASGEADPPVNDQPAAAAKEGELEEEDARDQMGTRKTQPSGALESVLAEQEDFIAPHPVDDETTTEKPIDEEGPDDVGTPAISDDLPELGSRPAASEPVAGSHPDKSVSEGSLRDGQLTQSSQPPTVSEEAGPAPDSSEWPMEQAPLTAKEPPANDETSLVEKGEKEVSPGGKEAKSAVDVSTTLPATTVRQTPNNSRQGSRRYEGLTRAPPKSATNSGNEPRRVASDSKVRERSLPIEVRLRFDRGGSCQVSLIPSRSSDAPEDTSVEGLSGSLDLRAMQDDWYQDVMTEDIGRVLNEGTVWSEAEGTRRWSLSGRDLYVLGARSDLSGWVSQPSVKLGQRHVVLCSERLRGSVEQALREAGVEHSAALDPSFGSPAGWFVIREVVPVRPVSPSQQADILNALRPLPELEICFEGGIRFERATWLHGYPPTIRVYGDPAQTPEVRIDGCSAFRGHDGAYQVPAWDAVGTHTVWCAGRSKSYSVVRFEASWELWDAYAFPVAPGFVQRVSICGPLVGEASGDRHDWSSTIQVPETNPVIVGARHGEQVLATRVSNARGIPRIATPSFRPVWALPTDPLRCRKQTTRILFLGEYVEPMPGFAGPSVSRRRPAVDTWAEIILNASRKGLAIEPNTEHVRALWKRYKQAARGIWMSRK